MIASHKTYLTYCNPERNTKEAFEKTVPNIDWGRGRVQKRDSFLNKEWITDVEFDLQSAGDENKKELAGEAEKDLSH